MGLAGLPKTQSPFVHAVGICLFDCFEAMLSPDNRDPQQGGHDSVYRCHEDCRMTNRRRQDSGDRGAL